MQYLKSDIRNKIYKAAVVEFRECGYSNASIRNIATNAEVSVGNVYRYFTDKESLYLAIINPFIEELNHYIEDSLSTKGATTTQLARSLVMFLLDHRDDVIIIRKSEKNYYDKFVGFIVDITSAKIKDLITMTVKDADKMICNPKFYDVIGQSFIYAIFKVIKSEDSKKVQEQKCKEIITFFFGNLKDRFYHFDVD